MEPGSNLPYFRIIESLLSADYLNQQKQNLFTKMFGLLEYFSPLPLLLLLLLLLLLFTMTFLQFMLLLVVWQLMTKYAKYFETLNNRFIEKCLDFKGSFIS